MRLTPTINEKIEQIAEYEDRTVSKTIQRLLDKAVSDYFSQLMNDKDFKKFFLEQGKKKQYEIERKIKDCEEHSQMQDLAVIVNHAEKKRLKQSQQQE